MSTDDHDVRYVLTRKGMEYLAARAGVPPGAYGQHTRIAFFDPAAGESPLDAVAHVEHTIGVNRFVVRLAADAREHGARLVRWLNEAESAHRFESNGRRVWIRPDGSGELALGGERGWFLLEYERGTLDGGDLRAKLAGYRRYYEQRVWERHYPEEPLLLFVCAHDRAERRVVRAMEAFSTRLPAFLTTEWRYEREGTFGAVWRGPDETRGSLFHHPDGDGRGGADASTTG